MPSEIYERNKALYARVLPGPGRIAVRMMKGGQEIDIGGGKKLWIADHQKMEGNLGEVVGTCGRYLKDGQEVEPNYKIGDVVVFGKYTGTEVQIDREAVIVCYDDDILCEILPPGAAIEQEPRLTLEERASAPSRG